MQLSFICSHLKTIAGKPGYKQANNYFYTFETKNTTYICNDNFKL